MYITLASLFDFSGRRCLCRKHCKVPVSSPEPAVFATGNSGSVSAGAHIYTSRCQHGSTAAHLAVVGIFRRRTGHVFGESSSSFPRSDACLWTEYIASPAPCTETLPVFCVDALFYCIVLPVSSFVGAFALFCFRENVHSQDSP